MRELAHDQAQELRLVGVHEDGAHLLVSAANGDVFRLPLDEALRRAVSRPAPQRPAPSGPEGAGMSPRQIQAEIRAGATAEEVAASSGVPLARVQRFEGPVVAEREHIARRAQAVEVPGHLPTQDALRGPHTDRPATLGEMAAYRLSLHGVSAASVEWDSWRRPDGQWTVVARFTLPDGAPSSIGEEPPAMWTYHPVHGTIANANRWAQQLSELEPLDGPSPRRRLAAVSDRPFDVDAPEGARGDTRRSDPPAPVALDHEAELLDMLRARRGQRLGVDEDGDDALALLLTHGIPAAHPRPEQAEAGVEPPAPSTAAHGAPHAAGSADARPDTEDFDEDADEDDAPVQRGGITSLLSRLNARTPDGGEDRLGLHPGMSTTTREITIVPAGPPSPRTSTQPPPSLARPTEPEQTKRDVPRGDPAPESPRRSSRPKRSSVPSWDEIVFGTKGD